MNKLITTLLFTLMFLIPQAIRADLKTITVEGQFTQSECLWWWGEDPFVELPLDCFFTFVYDDETGDADPYDSDFGQYLTVETAGGYTELAFYTPMFGMMVITLGGSEVQVWKSRGGLKGISFGNLWDETSNTSGLFYHQYFGLYCNFLVPASYNVTITNDSLSQVETLQDNTVMRSSSYSLHEGYNDPYDPEFQVTLQDNGIVYAVE